MVAGRSMYWSPVRAARSAASLRGSWPRWRPSRLALVEHGEFALYNIGQTIGSRPSGPRFRDSYRRHSRPCPDCCAVRRSSPTSSSTRRR